VFNSLIGVLKHIVVPELLTILVNYDIIVCRALLSSLTVPPFPMNALQGSDKFELVPATRDKDIVSRCPLLQATRDKDMFKVVDPPGTSS
jgi:hypothetical protein